MSASVDKQRYSRVWSSATIGIEALPIEIESFIAAGLPKHTVVGLPRGAVRESLDRIMAALRSTGIEVPRGAITINLAPADVRKDGTAFDLPVALSLISANKGIRWAIPPDDIVIMGELALDGTVRPVRGVLSMSMKAREDGRSSVIVPQGNEREAAIVKGLSVYPVQTLADAIRFLQNPQAVESHPVPLTDPAGCNSDTLHDYSAIRGQAHARRALEIAAAGSHNVVMLGSPGSGKTMLARAIPSIMPVMTLQESIEATRIHSTAGSLPEAGLIRARPFRAPHHTISDAGLVGGGNPPRPGEISLAHRGVLFLDELPEFRRNALESLRQPIEDGFIDIVRSDYRVRYPSKFMLVAAMNPCPCGYHGSDRPCECPPGVLHRYRSRISGPMLDRIDMHLDVRPVSAEQLSAEAFQAEASSDVNRRIEVARSAQVSRFVGEAHIQANADIPPGRLDHFVRPTSEARTLLRMAYKSCKLTPRSYHRILRVARTIADLAEDEKTTEGAVAEAIQYRSGVIE